MQINKTQLRNQVTLFLIFLARFAYLSVFRVSMKSRSDGDTQAIIRVRLIEKEKSLLLWLLFTNPNGPVLSVIHSLPVQQPLTLILWETDLLHEPTPHPEVVAKHNVASCYRNLTLNSFDLNTVGPTYWAS